MIDIYDVIKRPLLSERTMSRLDAHNTYVFEVHKKANKVQIRRAVEKLFGVKVTKVNTARMPGKPRRFGRNAIRTPSWKKAFVTLAADDAIDIL